MDPPPPAEPQLTAIGWVDCAEYHVYEVPRQGALGGDNRARIQLYAGQRFEEALDGLEGVERLWVVSLLHLTQTWHPKVAPPRSGAGKIGMFATRAPHRPNRIGLSCVRLLGVDGLTLEVADHDFVDRTPVLDLKPYLPYADSFPDSRVGWLEQYPLRLYRVELTDIARERLDFVQREGGLAAHAFVHAQLSTEPTLATRKRVSEQADGSWVIAYRTWRLSYRICEESRVVTVLDVFSGYSEEELAADEDRHEDKHVHRAFVARHA